MNWKKKKVDGNERKVDCWVSDCKTYAIYHNINDGIPPDNWKGPVDSNGHRWLFEVIKVTENGQETSIGTSPKLRAAKAIAECDAEGI